MKAAKRHESEKIETEAKGVMASSMVENSRDG
jgi:hypothetical protein